MYKGLNISVPAAIFALELADGDRKSAYIEYRLLYWEQTGKFDCGCTNKDLQIFYDDLEKLKEGQ